MTAERPTPPGRTPPASLGRRVAGRPAGRPAAAIAPVEAFCAIGPDQKIDIDMLRRNRASAEFAAKNVTGNHWVKLAAAGWSVVAVTIAPAGAPPQAPEPSGAKRPRPPPPPAPPAAASVQPRMSAREYRDLVGADDGLMLRCGRARSR